MSIFEKLIGASKKRAIANKPNLEQALKEKLTRIVYDEDLVNELLPVFMKLQGQEGFNEVMDLLESKEKQIETISNGDWFKQETNKEDKTINTNEEDEDNQETDNLVDSILNKKYGEK